MHTHRNATRDGGGHGSGRHAQGRQRPGRACRTAGGGAAQLIHLYQHQCVRKGALGSECLQRRGGAPGLWARPRLWARPPSGPSRPPRPRPMPRRGPPCTLQRPSRLLPSPPPAAPGPVGQPPPAAPPASPSPRPLQPAASTCQRQQQAPGGRREQQGTGGGWVGGTKLALWGTVPLCSVACGFRNAHLPSATPPRS